jgi:hypothetical protein
MSKRTADEESARARRLGSLRSASKRSASESSSPPYLPRRSVRNAPQQRSIQSDLSDEEAVDEEDEESIDDENEEAVDEDEEEPIDEADEEPIDEDDQEPINKDDEEPIDEEDDQDVDEEDDQDVEEEDDEAVDEESDPLLYRVLTGVEYTRAQDAQGRPVMQTTRFVLNTREQIHRRALRVLREAGRDGIATRVAMDDEREVWEIGVPRPDWVTEGALGGVHDPQWWHGLDAAEIRAGPHADDADVNRARTVLKGVETRRKNTLKKSAGEKSKKQQDTDSKLEEGLRRQQLGLKMNDSDDSETDRSLFIAEGSDSSSSSSSSDSDSDEEPLIRRLPRWRAEQQARSAATTDALRESSESLHSHGDHRDGSESDSSQSEPFVLEWRRWNASPQKSKDDTTSSEGEDDGPRIPVFSKWKAAQQKRKADALQSENEDDEPRIPVFSKWKAAQQKRRADALQPDSEDEGPRIPVFSKWKSARNSSMTDSLANAPTRRRSDAPSSSDEEDVLSPRRQMNSNKRRRMIIDSSDDD